jgi:mRNA interferase MazF
VESLLKRGEIWTALDDAAYARKPRPVVIIQNNHFAPLASVTICGFTSDPSEIPLFRVPIQPSSSNGLRSSSSIMVDKILTVPRARLGYRIGVLDDDDVARLNQAIAFFLGLIG